jgi:glycosyltransferase involved in cell wall biosynthesis
MNPATTTPDAPGPGAGRLSVLAVTSEPPWPLNTGGHLRTFHLLRCLARRFRVRLVVGLSAGQEGAVEALRHHGIDVRPAAVGARTPWREAARAVTAAVAREPYVLYRRHDRRPVRAALREQARLDPPAVLYLDHLDAALFRPLLPDVPAVLDLHNVYSLLVRRAAAEQARRWSRLYLRREATLLDRTERRSVRSVDAVFAVSEEEAQHFSALGPKRLHVIPNGVDCAAYEAAPAGPRAPAPTLLYLGTMSWVPNANAALFLAREVLPRVRLRFPDARVQIVGRDPPAEVLALNALPGVEVTGGVPDVKPYLRAAHVLAVPLEAGGGTRLKILEAFASGLPVVSTPTGCEGLKAVHGEHLVVAERERFAEGVISLLGGAAAAEALAERARALARARYDWNSIGEAACGAVAAVAN